jgi:hypothetical protein
MWQILTWGKQSLQVSLENCDVEAQTITASERLKLGDGPILH